MRFKTQRTKRGNSRPTIDHDDQPISLPTNLTLPNKPLQAPLKSMEFIPRYHDESTDQFNTRRLLIRWRLPDHKAILNAIVFPPVLPPRYLDEEMLFTLCRIADWGYQPLHIIEELQSLDEEEDRRTKRLGLREMDIILARLKRKVKTRDWNKHWNDWEKEKVSSGFSKFSIDRSSRTERTSERQLTVIKQPLNHVITDQVPELAKSHKTNKETNTHDNDVAEPPHGGSPPPPLPLDPPPEAQEPATTKEKAVETPFGGFDWIFAKLESDKRWMEEMTKK